MASGKSIGKNHLFWYHSVNASNTFQDHWTILVINSKSIEMFPQNLLIWCLLTSFEGSWTSTVSNDDITSRLGIQISKVSTLQSCGERILFLWYNHMNMNYFFFLPLYTRTCVLHLTQLSKWKFCIFDLLITIHIYTYMYVYIYVYML